MSRCFGIFRNLGYFHPYTQLNIKTSISLGLLGMAAFLHLPRKEELSYWGFSINRFYSLFKVTPDSHFDRDLVEPWVLIVKEFIDDIKNLSED
jgi:hypothetical protein